MEEKNKKSRASRAPKVVEQVAEEVVVENVVEEAIEAVPEIIEDISEIVEDETVEEQVAPVVEDQPKSGLRVGEAYIVRLNRFLGIMQSKYSVRVKTEKGFKEVAKSSRNKAYSLASDINRSHGFGTIAYIED